MPEKNEFKLEADDDGFQIGQMSGGIVNMPRFVARLGPWGFGGIAVFAIAAVVIVGLLVSRSGDSSDAGSTNPRTSSPGVITSGAFPDTGCDVDDSTVWLEASEEPYGPFTLNGVDYFVRWDTSGVWVRTGTESVETVNDLPMTLGRLDQWIPLFGHEALSVCQDDAGELFADLR